MPIYLGIDGGGSKTACAVGDDTGVLATATTGGSNLLRLGEARARAALQAAVRVACSAAGVNAGQVTHTCVGVAGASVPQVRETVAQIVGECVTGTVQVVADIEVAIEAALGGTAGIITIAGTGSVAFGRNAEGCVARAGGWGHAISDEGSGHWIGRRAVAAVMRAADEGETTTLEQAILAAWQLGSRAELVKTANAIPPPDFAGLLPAVVDCARAGDAGAAQVLAEAGAELARLATLVARRLWLPQQWVRVALAGGVLRHSATVRHAFHHALRTRRPNVAVSFSVTQPVMGALAMARRAARHAQ